MKIAFNAIRVSNKAGSGFDTYIINFINEFAKYVYGNPHINIQFDVYTLFPFHFTEVRKENIKQILNFKYNTRNFIFKHFEVEKQSVVRKQHKKEKNRFFSKINNLLKKITFFGLLSSIKMVLADYLRMFWTQIVFPVYALRYDLIVSLTEYDANIFLKKQIIFIHNTVPFLFRQFKTKYKFYIYCLFPKVVKNVFGIATVSSVTMQECIKIFNLKTKNRMVIYGGVNEKYFYPVDFKKVEDIKIQYGLKNDYILCVAHSHPIKNFKRMIEAIALVNQKKLDIDFVIVGLLDKKFFKELNTEVHLCLKKKVHFIGHVSNEKLSPFYTGAKLFLFATLHEGFGLPPLEAMACGCPVVVSNKGSLPEICGDAAVYVNPYNPEDIAEGILKVLTDENLRQQLIKKGFEQVKKFSWEKSVKSFLDVLLQIKDEIL
ncbi:MAG: glycosyltransferase family 1 protein [Endomicrobiia bacterium]